VVVGRFEAPIVVMVLRYVLDASVYGSGRDEEHDSVLAGLSIYKDRVARELVRILILVTPVVLQPSIQPHAIFSRALHHIMA